MSSIGSYSPFNFNYSSGNNNSINNDQYNGNTFQGFGPNINPNDPMAGNKMLGLKLMQIGGDLTDDGIINGSFRLPPPPPMNPMKRMMKMMMNMMKMMMQLMGLGNQQLDQYNNNPFSSQL